MKIYLAGPLFTEAEQTWLKALKIKLETAGFEVVWPYELFAPTEISEWGMDAPLKIMVACRGALLECDMVVACLDGAQVDDGTAWELGYACAKNIPVAGIRTDARFGGETPNGKVNAMIAGSCGHIATTTNDLLELLSKTVPPLLHI